jgi:hypothetical protein
LKDAERTRGEDNATDGVLGVCSKWNKPPLSLCTHSNRCSLEQILYEAVISKENKATTKVFDEFTGRDEVKRK